MRRPPLHPLLALLGVLSLGACHGETLQDWKTPETIHSAFDFKRDTFAFANETVFEYKIPPSKSPPRRRHEANSDYTLRCFVMTRSARQFFQHARFDPTQHMVSDAAYAELVRRVVATDPREDRPNVIPGYPNLRAFSAAREQVVKEQLGGA